MAHLQKFTRGAVGGLSIHIERKTSNHSNKEIDPERTKLNYDLCQKSGDMNDRLSKRLAEVYCFKRADVKVMADWVVTLPEELKGTSEAEQRRFFEETYGFLADRYGEKNVLAGVVHNDEKTPHMHFSFVPVAPDLRKPQREKVSAKEVLNRKELQTFHQDLDTHLKERIPAIYQQGILNNKTIGVDSVKILKEKNEEIQAIQQKLDLQKERLIEQESEYAVQQTAVRFEIYETWKESWQETKRVFPDFELSIALEDYSNKGLGIIAVDEETPKTYSFSIKAVFKLIRTSMNLAKERMLELLSSLSSKASELHRQENILADRENALEGKLEGFKRMSTDLEKEKYFLQIAHLGIQLEVPDLEKERHKIMMLSPKQQHKLFEDMQQTLATKLGKDLQTVREETLYGKENIDDELEM